MCVKCCDCNNCYKTKTCTDCEHSQYVDDFLNVDCNSNGVQGCHYIIPFKLNIKEQANKSSDN